jgi:hypothetical protein
MSALATAFRLTYLLLTRASAAGAERAQPQHRHSFPVDPRRAARRVCRIRGLPGIATSKTPAIAANNGATPMGEYGLEGEEGDLHGAAVLQDEDQQEQQDQRGEGIHRWRSGAGPRPQPRLGGGVRDRRLPPPQHRRRRARCAQHADDPVGSEQGLGSVEHADDSDEGGGQ